MNTFFAFRFPLLVAHGLLLAGVAAAQPADAAAAAPAAAAASVASAPQSAAQAFLGEAGPARLPGAREHRIHSPATGRHYRIQVTAVGKPPAQGYPVLYVLDGDALFPVVSISAQGMAMRADENGVVPMLVVGVGYADAHLLDEQARAEDYTPPAADLSNTGDTRAKRQGGAERFLQFLTQQLQPAVASAYPVDTSRQALLGHSYGGLFTLYAMLRQPQAFGVYLASSPSVWWNQGYIHQLRDAQLAQGRAQLPTAALRISIGEYEQSPSPLIADSPRAEMMRQRGQVDHARRYAQAMQALLPGRAVQFAQYPEATHATAALHGIVDGLRFASACWQEPQCRPPRQRP